MNFPIRDNTEPESGDGHGGGHCDGTRDVVHNGAEMGEGRQVASERFEPKRKTSEHVDVLIFLLSIVKAHLTVAPRNTIKVPPSTEYLRLIDRR